MYRHRCAALIVSATSLIACAEIDESIEPDHSVEYDEPVVESEMSDEPRQLALLELSPTHTVEFLASEHSTQVVERFHADRDWATGQDFMFKLPADVRSLADIYAELAGDALDPLTFDALRAVDGLYEPIRLDELAPELEMDARELRTPSSARELEALLDADAEQQLGRVSQGLCAEPAWNWVGDDQWFRERFCPSGAQYCDSLDRSHSTSWLSAPRKEYEAFGFAQSHCATAKFESWVSLKKPCGFLGLSSCWDTYGPRVYEVPARWVQAHRETGFRNYPHRYKSRITTVGGNFVGLSARAW